MKLIIGAGGTWYPGWVNTDKDTLDATIHQHWCRVVAGETVTHILAEHVLEHFTAEETRIAMLSARAVLAIGGRFRIAVPDAWHPDPAYQQHVAPPADGHRQHWNCVTLRIALENCGFEVRPLEWWHPNGHFTRRYWHPKHGMVQRSLHHDRRNADGEPNYTSLIVDAFKP